jgi:hypothetical protein
VRRLAARGRTTGLGDRWQYLANARPADASLETEADGDGRPTPPLLYFGMTVE